MTPDFYGKLIPRLSPRAERSLRQTLQIVGADDRFRNALASILTKEEAARDFSDPVVWILSAISCTAVSQKPFPRKNRIRLWAAGTGKTWKTMREFSKRLRQIGDEVEAVGRGLYFEPRRWLHRTSAARKRALELNQLPTDLRRYADHVDAVVRALPILTERSLNGNKSRRSELIALLCKCVKAATGRYHDAKVVELLDAAAQALGKTTFHVDIPGLQKARSRQKRLDHKPDLGVTK